MKYLMSIFLAGLFVFATVGAAAEKKEDEGCLKLLVHWGEFRSGVYVDRTIVRKQVMLIVRDSTDKVGKLVLVGLDKVKATEWYPCSAVLSSAASQKKHGGDFINGVDEKNKQ